MTLSFIKFLEGLILTFFIFYVIQLDIFYSLFLPYDSISPLLHIISYLLLIYLAFVSRHYIVKFYDSVRSEHRTTILKELSATLVFIFYIVFTFTYVLINAYGALNIKLHWDTQSQMLISTIYVVLPQIIWLVLNVMSDKSVINNLFKKYIELQRNNIAHESLRAESTSEENGAISKFKLSNESLTNLIKDIIETDAFRSDIHHYQYKAFYVTNEETLSFSMDKTNPFSEIGNNFDLDIKNIELDTIKILEQVYTASCASVVYEFKVQDKENCYGKINVHSILTSTEFGWLILSDTIEINTPQKIL